MSKTVEIKCDHCEKDLTYTGNCEDYYVALVCQSKGMRGGAMTSMAISPPIEQDHHFCDLRCLGPVVAKSERR